MISYKQARIEAGISLDEAAEAFGISPTTLMKIENHAITPNEDFVEVMADLYGCKANEFKVDYKAIDARLNRTDSYIVAHPNQDPRSYQIKHLQFKNDLPDNQLANALGMSTGQLQVGLGRNGNHFDKGVWKRCITYFRSHDPEFRNMWDLCH